MATINILRQAGGRTLLQAFGKQSLRTGAIAGQLIPRQTLMLSPALHGRIYGPAVGLPSKTTHWKQERILAVGLIGVIPVAIAFPSTIGNYALAAGVILHTHWGLHGVITDYMHGPTLPKVMHFLLYFLSIAAFAGLCNLNYNDIGFAQAIHMLYSKL